MDKIKPYKEQKEDISLGFEQFSRGEYLDAWDFVNSLHH